MSISTLFLFVNCAIMLLIMRIFVAFKLPNEVINEVLERQKALENFGWPMRWNRAENMHITLEFLGDLSEQQLSTLTGTIQHHSKNSPPFFFSLGKAGYFPNFNDPKVLIINAELDGSVAREFRNKVHEELVLQKISRDFKPWKPHITLGRFNKKVLIDERILSIVPPQIRWEAKTVGVFESELSPTGARHKLLREFKLEG